jgi:hypothetical protein
LIARGAVYSEDGKYILLPHVCPHLVPALGGSGGLEEPDDQLSYECDIHDTPDYPLSCKRYHGHGNFYKPPGCGYLE